MNVKKVKNTEGNRDKRLENLAPAFKPGQSGNPNGRPFGKKNYATLYKEALIKIAESEGIDPADLEIELVSKAVLSGRKGDFRFHKDTMDRLLGSPAQTIDVTTKGEPITGFNMLPPAQA